MAGVYAAIAGVLLSVIALTLFREGRRSGSFAVLFALLVGGSLEPVMNGPTGYLYAPHRPPGYPVARAAALVIAYRPTFMRLEERKLKAAAGDYLFDNVSTDARNTGPRADRLRPRGRPGRADRDHVQQYSNNRPRVVVQYTTTKDGKINAVSRACSSTTRRSRGGERHGSITQSTT